MHKLIHDKKEMTIITVKLIQLFMLDNFNLRNLALRLHLFHTQKRFEKIFTNLLPSLVFIVHQIISIGNLSKNRVENCFNEKLCSKAERTIVLKRTSNFVKNYEIMISINGAHVLFLQEIQPERKKFALHTDWRATISIAW